MTLDYDATYAALHDRVVGRVVARDVVVVEGPDAASYLQGQCSQDLAGMVAGEARRSLLLSPQGKVVALVRVVAPTETADSAGLIGSVLPDAPAGLQRFVVEVEQGYGEIVFERLRRFKLRVKIELELLSWRCAEVRGPDADGLLSSGAAGAAVVLLQVDDRFGHGWDLLGPDAELTCGVPSGDEAAFEAVRIEAGVPAMGSELGEEIIPQEAGIVGETVSFSKGCYTGQELVARLDARGNRVAKLLRGVVLAGTVGGAAALPPVGTELLTGDRVVGELTSVAWSPRLLAPVALAYVRREVVPPAKVRVAQPGAAATTLPLEAQVLELPF